MSMFENPVDVQLATDESSVQCLGEGDICLVNQGKVQWLRKVQYVLGAANLLSVSRAVQDGLWFTHNTRGEPVGAYNPKTVLHVKSERETGCM